MWTSEVDRPTLWPYAEPGLMAASFKPGKYDGLVIAYPDAQHTRIEFAADPTTMPDSIPAPSQRLGFEPIVIDPDTVVYIGTIRIAQHYGLWDQFLDRVEVEFSVTDGYERTVADFRARYPQFQDTPVERRLAQVVPPGH